MGRFPKEIGHKCGWRSEKQAEEAEHEAQFAAMASKVGQVEDNVRSLTVKLDRVLELLMPTLPPAPGEAAKGTRWLLSLRGNAAAK